MDDDQQQPVTRLGPDSGGRMPGEPPIRVYHWEWGSDNEHRPGLPWIGIFLLVFGGLLLLQQVFPEFAGLGSVIVLAIGLAFLVKWAIDRGTASLYAARSSRRWRSRAAERGRRRGERPDAPSAWGVAFLFIAVVRAGDRRRGRLADLVRRPAGGHRRRPDRQCAARRLHPAARARRPRDPPDRPWRGERPALVTRAATACAPGGSTPRSSGAHAGSPAASSLRR